MTMSLLQRLFPSSNMSSASTKNKKVSLYNRPTSIQTIDASNLPDFSWLKNATVDNHYSSSFNPFDDDDVDPVVEKWIESPVTVDSLSDITSVASSSSSSQPSTSSEDVHPFWLAAVSPVAHEPRDSSSVASVVVVENPQSDYFQQVAATPSKSTEALEMAEWLAEYMSIQIIGPQSAYEQHATNVFEGGGALYFRDFLAANNVPPQTVICALFFLSKLFPHGFVFDEKTPTTGLDIRLLCIRIFTIGCVLGTKWTQDGIEPTRTWASQLYLSVSAFNDLDRAALELLDYNIMISRDDFRAWCIELYRHSSVQAGGTSADFVLELLERNIVACSTPLSSLSCHRPDPTSGHPSMQKLCWGLMQIREPEAWDPRAGAIVGEKIRTQCIAPSWYNHSILEKAPEVPDECLNYRLCPAVEFASEWFDESFEESPSASSSSSDH